MNMRPEMDVIGEETLVRWTQDFVRHPSPQTDLFEAEPQVQTFIDEVAKLVASLGLEGRRDAMGNLIVEVGEGKTDRSLMLMAYAMTHPASAMKDPYDGIIVEREGKRAVRGRGVSEQKGSLAASLAATVAAARKGISGRLVFTVSTAGETGRHDAAEAIIKDLGYVPKLGVVVIGTSGKATLGNKGRLDVEITAHGRASHSSTPWEGVNAIEGLRQVLNQLGSVAFEAGNHPGLGQATLTPTYVESMPRATHTVQAKAHLRVDRRLLPGQEPDLALGEIRAALSLPEPWRLDVEPGPFMYPCEISPEGPLVTAIRAGCRKMGVKEPELSWSHGALDAGYLQEIGCEPTMWGPGSIDLWHRDEEYILVDDLVDGARAYLGLIEETVS